MTPFKRVCLLFWGTFLALALDYGELPAQADDFEWQVGLAKADITPDEPIWLAGYAVRNKPSEGTSQPLSVKALTLEDSRRGKLIIIASDILGFTRELSDPIARRLEKRFKLRRDQIVFTSSHTHAAPVLREYAVFAYGLTPEQTAAIERYSRMIEEKTFLAVTSALKNKAPARLSFGRGKAGFAINRRVAAAKGVTIGVNDTGPVDHQVSVLRIEGKKGNLRGVLFSYACHNTTLGGDFYQVNGDYAGYAQAALEQNHPGALALFVLGCAGDINPNPRGKLEDAQKHGIELAAAVDTISNDSMTLVRGPLSTALESIPLPFATPPTRDELEARLAEKDVIRRRHARRMLDILAKDGHLPSHYPYPVQVARFGRSLTFVALGGEVVVDYSLRLKRELSDTPLFLIAYANDVMGYIPSVRILKEGGYEGGGSMIFYGRPGPWSEQVEETIVKKVHELVARTDRK